MLIFSTLFFLVTGYPHFEPNVGVYDYRPLVESIILIPGCGEALYDTEIVHDSGKKLMNKHIDQRADVLSALDNIQKQYPNLKNVSVVVGWFGDSIRADKMTIAPRVEDKYLFKNDSWSVGELTRKTAKRVSKVNGQDNWGGTVSDKSLANLVVELNRRGYNVTLYPMLFIDVKWQPWRGDIIAANDESIDAFFKEYEKFVLFYANFKYKEMALKNYIKTFIIGSELMSLTNRKLAVDRLIDLAAKSRQALGSDIKITYAANWDEYHHDLKTGTRYLDALWADKNIDFVGIDAYFPLTDNLPQSAMTPEVLTKGWESGVFWDYDQGAPNVPIKPEMAIKNVEYWWKNEHLNPDGSKTPWRPKMKPIVFTEYGFYATDGTANEPSAFYDSMSRDSHYPPTSKGRYDINAQALALKVSEEFWRRKSSLPGNEGLAATRYIWAYDVSPPDKPKKPPAHKKKAVHTNH